jgi:hypothetical protein
MSAQIVRKLFTIDDCYKMAEVGILPPDERTELINEEILVVPRLALAMDSQYLASGADAAHITLPELSIRVGVPS